ncbi:hypothetical protein [Algoriphagus sp. AK58]|uniref:hypothetical protein n=1 Tax=Algoriphagus sp. AK58 TaxID=1406877 RepID=UPI00164F3AAF|nr:hypothetical protein [Algoriphagus sp. AK58]MBC6368020.1 hypothetical protein [Algoriphagus sp. AK58]
MEELLHFRYPDRDDLTAAVLGVSSVEWRGTTNKEFSQNREGVFTEMYSSGFDILPSLDRSGKTTHFVSSSKWGKISLEGLELVKIDHLSDVIYYLTHVRDVVRLMVEKGRNFFFLSNHTEIVGLLTIANFNDKHFYFWLYKKILSLEKGLSEFIQQNLTETDIYTKVQEISLSENDPRGYFSEVLSRFLEDKESGADASLLEYLYLRQLCELVIHFRLYAKIGLTKSDFESGLGVLNETRKRVAHPTKSLIRSQSDLKDLWKGIKKIDSIQTRLLWKQ